MKVKRTKSMDEKETEAEVSMLGNIGNGVGIDQLQSLLEDEVNLGDYGTFKPSSFYTKKKVNKKTKVSKRKAQRKARKVSRNRKK